MRKFLTACLFSAGSFLSAFGWGSEGHMVVAQMAYNHLTPGVKARCNALISVSLAYGGSSTSDFVTASVWADDYRNQLGTAIWHYIDIPFSLDNTPTTNFIPPNFDVLQAINLCVSNLASAVTAETNKATALRYLLHFVGDIHQPLHCSTEISTSLPDGDRGGNDFLLTNGFSNLHSLWDSGGGYISANSLTRPLTTSGLNTISNRVFEVESLYPYVPNSGTVADPMSWPQEGWNLAQTVCYVGIAQNTTPSSSYTNTAQSTTKQRLAAGGHRLADLLNTILTTNSMALACSPATNGQFTFSWPAVPGRNYRVQWKQKLSDLNWQALTNVVAASNGVVLSDSAGSTQRFYRVAQ